ncbi:MAG: hypothetical protein ACSHW1_20720 [Yoonia sp.]|uniref:hypothetical protein n=1 Tax=Yoonia sp. TaxID=2212373 RepID=UPI003EF503C5
MFGQNVQWWLRDMRMDRMEALAQKRQQVETDLLQTLRGLTDDPVTAVALYDVYMDRINKRDMYNGRYTGRWDSFAVIHVAYMFVFLIVGARQNMETVVRPMQVYIAAFSKMHSGTWW